MTNPSENWNVSSFEPTEQLPLPVSFDQKRLNDARKFGTEKEANKKEVRIIISSRISAITSDVLDQSFWKLSCK